MMRAGLIAIAALAMLGCHGRTDVGGPGPGPTPVRPTPPAEPPSNGAVAPGSVAAGGACEIAADCASGVCQGMGCGPRQGVCADKMARCTRDLVAYCGCDGKTFRASSTCPGQRFANKGECGGSSGGANNSTPAKRPDGASCRVASDCASGICEGKGCGDENGRCASKMRACTMDMAPYCGCNGKTFRTSGSCPGRRYKRRGECPR
jgi:hypothetical protein